MVEKYPLFADRAHQKQGMTGAAGQKPDFLAFSNRISSLDLLAPYLYVTDDVFWATSLVCYYRAF